MPKSSFMVRPKAPARPVMVDYIVVFTDPDSKELMEFDLTCPRGTFFTAVRIQLRALGYDPDKFRIEDQERTWLREPVSEYR